jgi:hypothetical protein
MSPEVAQSGPSDMSGYLVAVGGKADIKPRTGGQYEYTAKPGAAE